MNSNDLKIDIARQQLEAAARADGFATFGIASAQSAPSYPKFQEWLDHGFAGTMSYLADRDTAYEHPSGVLEACKSVIMLGLPYARPESVAEHSVVRGSKGPHPGLIGAYASGDADYHDLIRAKLNRLLDKLNEMFPDDQSRGVVDTAPLLERDFARLAGLGWIGKNSMLIHPRKGSYLFLAAILTTTPFASDESFDKDHCGKCQACIEACPTKAIIAPRILDARRCISYLTIELRGPIEEEFRQPMGEWLFGCDVCQVVCPWNRKPKNDVDEALQPNNLETKGDCLHWLSLDQESFRILYRKTPFWRTRLPGMQRNAMIVAANTGRTDCVDAIRCFLEHEDLMLKEVAEWAIEQLRLARK